MSFQSRFQGMIGAISLVMTTAAPPLVLIPSPAKAQDMSAACKASGDALTRDQARYGEPPESADLIVRMQHILWATGRMLDTLDSACRDWGGYAQTRRQVQATYDATMQNCLNSASNPSYCRRHQWGT